MTDEKLLPCQHKWSAENVGMAPDIRAIVVCLWCFEVKKPLGRDGPTLRLAVELRNEDLR